MYKGKNRTCWNTADDPFQVEGGMSSAVAQGTVAQGDGCSGGLLLVNFGHVSSLQIPLEYYTK